MALLFVAFTLLIFLLGTFAAVYYIPRALGTDADEREDEPPGQAA